MIRWLKKFEGDQVHQWVPHICCELRNDLSILILPQYTCRDGIILLYLTPDFVRSFFCAFCCSRQVRPFIFFIFTGTDNFRKLTKVNGIGKNSRKRLCRVSYFLCRIH